MARTPTTRRRGLVRRAGLTLLCGSVAVAVIGCGGDDDEEDTGTDPTAEETTTSPSTTAPLTAEEEANAVYLEFVEVVERLATEAPDPNDQDLLRIAVDPVLSSVRDGMSTQQAENQIWQRGDQTSHDVGTAERTPEGMQLQDCVVENDALIDLDDGSVVDAPPLTTRALEITLQQTADGWVVSEVATTQRFDGAVRCGA